MFIEGFLLLADAALVAVARALFHTATAFLLALGALAFDALLVAALLTAFVLDVHLRPRGDVK